MTVNAHEMQNIGNGEVVNDTVLIGEIINESQHIDEADLDGERAEQAYWESPTGEQEQRDFQQAQVKKTDTY